MTRQTDTTLAPGTEFTAEFEVTGWDERPYDEPAEGGTLARVTVRKTFRGVIEGTSVTELLTAANRGYVASERFTGSIDGRHGTVVFQHGGLDAETPRTFGHIVPGTGTGELTGLLGTIAYRHDESGHSVRLVLG
ncbi:DUF3224 domain-containing protein [Plantactinospora sp. CA-294935]|uniref:DUF3224 domain-containing protein n=1 Tax=Plantactinospora sp. CA-294935 TaxID=3240012 RepID=UPI003D8EA862